MKNTNYESMTLEEIIAEIVFRNEIIHDNCSDMYGWAPHEAAELLDKSRLDRQVSLSQSLKLWNEDPKNDASEGHLILAWINLGSLVEGTMKLFLSVYLSDYKREPARKWNKEVDPDELQLENLRQYFAEHNIWTDGEESSWNKWVQHIQQRRNAIHAYKHREIGNFKEFWNDLREYLEFLDELEGRVPYPEYTEGYY